MAVNKALVDTGLVRTGQADGARVESPCGARSPVQPARSSGRRARGTTRRAHHPPSSRRCHSEGCVAMGPCMTARSVTTRPPPRCGTLIRDSPVGICLARTLVRTRPVRIRLVRAFVRPLRHRLLRSVARIKHCSGGECAQSTPRRGGGGCESGPGKRHQDEHRSCSGWIARVRTRRANMAQGRKNAGRGGASTQTDGRSGDAYVRL